MFELFPRSHTWLWLLNWDVGVDVGYWWKHQVSPVCEDEGDLSTRFRLHWDLIHPKHDSALVEPMCFWVPATSHFPVSEMIGCSMLYFSQQPLLCIYRFRPVAPQLPRKEIGWIMTLYFQLWVPSCIAVIQQSIHFWCTY